MGLKVLLRTGRRAEEVRVSERGFITKVHHKMYTLLVT